MPRYVCQLGDDVFECGSVREVYGPMVVRFKDGHGWIPDTWKWSKDKSVCHVTFWKTPFPMDMETTVGAMMPSAKQEG